MEKREENFLIFNNLKVCVCILSRINNIFWFFYCVDVRFENTLSSVIKVVVRCLLKLIQKFNFLFCFLLNLVQNVNCSFFLIIFYKVLIRQIVLLLPLHNWNFLDFLKTLFFRQKVNLNSTCNLLSRRNF